METVWKVRIPAQDTFTIDMPADAQILCVHYQDDPVSRSQLAHFWVRLDPEQPTVERKFQIVGTGTEINDPDDATYVGTAHVIPFVFHLFEMTEGGDT